MQRHPLNKNLRIHHGKTFEGFPIMNDKGPFIYEHLAKLKLTMQRALAQYPRVFAFRFDLRFPADMQLSNWLASNAPIGTFMESFKAQIESNRAAALRVDQYAHTSEVRYVWAREQGQGSEVHHYHLLILLNQDAFYTVGRLGSAKTNMIQRLEQAWAFALGLTVPAVQGLVHIADNGEYRISRDNVASQSALFHRASYLCKVPTKPLGNGYHVFDSSRN